MIIVNLMAQLGNQLFQYAFAMRVAKERKCLFILNPINDSIHKYFYWNSFTNILYSKYSKIFFRLYVFIFNKIHRNIIKQIGTENPNDILIINNVNYCGFFQSEQYFNNVRDVIKNKLKIKSKYIVQFKNKYGTLFSENKIIVLNFRRGEDYQKIDKCLPLSYYDNCLKMILNIAGYKIICVSDDIEYCKETFKGNNYIFATDTVDKVMMDFQLMLNADIVIIPNSSFSWWAAYLNNKLEKIIYSPKYWWGFKDNKEFPVGITCNDFIPVDVF